jgi:hypothetical protein
MAWLQPNAARAAWPEDRAADEGASLPDAGRDEQQQPERDERPHPVQGRQRREVVQEHLCDGDEQERERAQAQHALVAA